MGHRLLLGRPALRQAIGAHLVPAQQLEQVLKALGANPAVLAKVDGVRYALRCALNQSRADLRVEGVVLDDKRRPTSSWGTIASCIVYLSWKGTFGVSGAGGKLQRPRVMSLPTSSMLKAPP